MWFAYSVQYPGRFAREVAGCVPKSRPNRAIDRRDRDAVKRLAKWTILLCRIPEQSSLTVSRFAVIAASRLEWRSPANPAGLDCSPLRYSSILRCLRQTAVPRRGRRANIAGRFCAGAAGCCWSARVHFHTLDNALQSTIPSTWYLFASATSFSLRRLAPFHRWLAIFEGSRLPDNPS